MWRWRDWDGAWPRDLLERWTKFLQEGNPCSPKTRGRGCRSCVFEVPGTRALWLMLCHNWSPVSR